MKFSELKSIDILFENAESLNVDKKAINNIDMSEVVRDIQVMNGYIIEQITAKYILIEFNKNLFNTNYLNDEFMFASKKNGLVTLSESLDVHFNKAKDVVSFTINSIDGEVIKLNVPWSQKDYNRNLYMEFIEGYDTFTLLFDSSKK